ncbi:YybH family protein [Ruegeria atlantica]|uniref:YybH family protein n=1 Tax=Ruegeria atlantica TaxID=81569 RepID=UPI00147F5C36|nr:nuclear transport factor 2 family protein [Ruegeria atlantica]
MADMSLPQSDLLEIEQVLRQALANISNRDFESWLKHWTHDAVIMPPEMDDIKGLAELRAWIREWPAIRRFEIESIEIEGAGDLAVVICHFARVLEMPDGGETRRPARQMLKFRRQEGKVWQIAAALFNGME